MRKYLYQKEVLAERATQAEASEKLGRKIENFFYGTDGYLVTDIKEKEANWMPKSVFEEHTTQFDTPVDVLRYMATKTEQEIEWLQKYTRKSKPSVDKRNRLYLAIRRLKAYKSDLDSILHITLIEE